MEICFIYECGFSPILFFTRIDTEKRFIICIVKHSTLLNYIHLLFGKSKNKKLLLIGLNYTLHFTLETKLYITIFNVVTYPELSLK